MHGYYFILSIAFLALSSLAYPPSARYLEQMDIAVDPSTILVKDGEGAFELQFTVPADRQFRKMDSIRFEFHAENGTDKALIGTAIYKVPTDWDGKSPLSERLPLDITNYDMGEARLVLTTTFLKGYKQLVTDPLEVGRLVKE